ncbi:phospholipase D-like domain-containing protein [Paraburkholderia phenazinium]|uniref:phospholipase D-like domain-containing protein n=1 Tax=Paraburkholderia phenazinium TaxID=60549 RepID=UPI001FC864FE|nr:phospholipase D-like domain-containing protein [Paraburkholderia phenazinium]
MKKNVITGTLAASLLAEVCLIVVRSAIAGETANAQSAFSPHGGAEQLVIGSINASRQSIRVMAYSFTAQPVVRALILAKRRGVDVAVTVDYRNNLEEDRSGHARAALGALTYAGIPVRVVNAFPMQHSNRNLECCYMGTCDR